MLATFRHKVNIENRRFAVNTIANLISRPILCQVYSEVVVNGSYSYNCGQDCILNVLSTSCQFMLFKWWQNLQALKNKAELQSAC